MTALTLQKLDRLDRLGLKGPRAAEWLTAQGIAVPTAPNRWIESRAVLVARLGASEFFLEDQVDGTTLRGIEPAAESAPSGVYPVLREDVALQLWGDGSLEALAQVCNVNFGDLDLAAQEVIMTSMIGVSVLIVAAPGVAASRAQRRASPRFRIWCDPTFGPYLEQSLGTVVVECGGEIRSVST